MCEAIKQRAGDKGAVGIPFKANVGDVKEIQAMFAKVRTLPRRMPLFPLFSPLSLSVCRAVGRGGGRPRGYFGQQRRHHA